MEKLAKKQKIDDVDEKENKEKDDSQRVAPSRKYSILEDDVNPNFIENNQKIETF